MRYSVRQLLKEKQKQLSGLKAIREEENKYTFDVNEITVFADRHELIYGDNYVMVAFYNGDTRVASLPAFCGDDFDDAFIVEDCGKITSETSYRIMASDMNNK